MILFRKNRFSFRTKTKLSILDNNNNKNNIRLVFQKAKEIIFEMYFKERDWSYSRIDF